MAVTDPGMYAFDVPRSQSPYALHKAQYRHTPTFRVPRQDSPYWLDKHDVPFGPGGQPVGDGDYIMLPGARLEIGPGGKPYETLGQDTGEAIAGAGKSMLLLIGVAVVVGFAFVRAPKR